MIAEILPPAAASAEATGTEPGDAGSSPGLFPAEESALRTAGPRRRAEFAAGRRCAREALARLGLPAAPVPVGPAGEPRWPAGVTGSITHCAGYLACAVALVTDVAGIGIDAEPDDGLPAGLVESLATEAERAWIARQAAAAPMVHWDRLLFSAKEAAAKLWYPLTGRWPGLRQVAVFPTAGGTFGVRVAGPGPAADDGRPARVTSVTCRQEITGRWLARGGLIVTAVTLEKRLLRVTWITVSLVIDIRNCEQCGTSFVPRREHARFCSARCRVAWNRQHVGDPPTEADALGWTIVAMREAIDRLLRARSLDQPHAFAAISEAVWWVTMVDATLVRYHPDIYDAALAGHDVAERRIIEGTFGGLRFVRNWMGYHADHADFIRPQPDPGRPGAGPIAAWTWRSLAEPALASLPARGQEWEMTRYREYQANLAGRPVGETFRRAAAFLNLASAGSLLGSQYA